MEEYFDGLRTIKTRSDNVHSYAWPCVYLVFIGMLIAAVFPPLGILAPLAMFFWFFLLYRLSLSTCPRCGHKFYSLGDMLLGGSFYTKSGMWAVSCSYCSLKLSALPEVNEIKIKSHTDEWFQ